MTSLAGNPHHGSANHHSDGTPSDQAYAQAQATLSLAYEQRTANLISILNGRAFIPVADYNQLERDILARLGIATEPTK